MQKILDFHLESESIFLTGFLHEKKSFSKSSSMSSKSFTSIQTKLFSINFHRTLLNIQNMICNTSKQREEAKLSRVLIISTDLCTRVRKSILALEKN